MNTLTVVDAMGLAAAYTAARYGVQMDSEVVELRPGHRAVELEERWPASSYAFITAWNPASYPRHEEANLAADALLTTRLDALGVERQPAWAEGPDGQWQESGWLLRQIDNSSVNQLGIAFGQAAILAWDAGKPVSVRMLMPEPCSNGAFGGDPHRSAELAGSLHWSGDRRDTVANA